ncbi:MAG: arylesterase [Gammaproteobacteria bacterium]|nr:MAG: arylesterase [Gammaproteobacteria bacterium]
MAADAERSILVLGDSLSAGYGVPLEQGWVALLQDRLDAEGYEYRVVNASITGDTTSGGLRRLPRALDTHRPDIVIIELGGNDGLRGTPLQVTRENLRRMIELCRERGAQVVLAGIQLPPNYGARYTEAFARIYRELAGEYGAELIPFFMEGVALDPQMMQADGIHPNAAAQRRLLDNAWAALEPLLQNGRSG